jgi:hypothetical protein
VGGGEIGRERERNRKREREHKSICTIQSQLCKIYIFIHRETEQKEIWQNFNSGNLSFLKLWMVFTLFSTFFCVFLCDFWPKHGLPFSYQGMPFYLCLCFQFT